MNRNIEPLSKKALDCFIHGVAHLIEEQGKDQGLQTAIRALALIEEELDERVLTSNQQTASGSGR